MKWPGDPRAATGDVGWRDDPDPGRRLSILYVSARYPPFIGGTEIHTAEVARRMAQRGHDVTVLTTAFEPLPTGEEFVDGVRVVRVRAWPADYDLYFAPAVRTWIAGGSWDIVHCQGYHTLVAPLAMGACAAGQQPFVVTFHSGGHSSLVRRSFRPLQQALLRPLLARADRLIGVSRFETQFFERRLRLPAERFVTITNGVSAHFLAADTYGHTVDGNTVDGNTAGDGGGHGRGRRTVICSVGRLERYKGHHRVIAAMPVVRKQIPDVVLTIVGDGPYRRELEVLARRLGVDDVVEFTSVEPSQRNEMAALFRRADLVTLLSDYESQGVVGLEALAVGRPLLVADGTALAELGAFGNVSIVPPHVDPQSLGWLIARTVRQAIAPQHEPVPVWEDTVDALIAVYSDVVRGRRAGVPADR